MSDAHVRHVAAAGALVRLLSPVLHAAQNAQAFNLRCERLREQSAAFLHCAPRSAGRLRKRSPVSTADDALLRLLKFRLLQYDTSTSLFITNH